MAEVSAASILQLVRCMPRLMKLTHYPIHGSNRYEKHFHSWIVEQLRTTQVLTGLDKSDDVGLGLPDWMIQQKSPGHSIFGTNVLAGSKTSS